MDSEFEDFVVRQLQALVADIQAGRQPTNAALAQKIFSELRYQQARS